MDGRTDGWIDGWLVGCHAYVSLDISSLPFPSLSNSLRVRRFVRYLTLLLVSYIVASLQYLFRCVREISRLIL